MIPSIGLKINLDIAIKAPVLPAETIASALPDLTNCIDIPIDEFLPFRKAMLGLSFALITSLVWIISEQDERFKDSIKGSNWLSSPKKEKYKLG